MKDKDTLRVGVRDDGLCCGFAGSNRCCSEYEREDDAPDGILCGRQPSRLRLLWWSLTNWIPMP